MATTNINLNNVATQTEVDSLDTRVTTLENATISGYVPVETFADLPATGVVDTAYVVINDSDDTKNGTYTWNGSSYDYLGNPTSSIVDKDNTTVAVNGKAVGDFLNQRISGVLKSAEPNKVYQNVETGEYYNQASTFSGWGSYIGVAPEFDVIKFKLRSWNGSDPITQVRVRIRENDRTGTILFNELISYTPDINNYVTVLMDKSINTVTPLYFEYLTDGLCGWYGFDAGTPTYPSSQYYTTSQDVVTEDLILNGTVSDGLDKSIQVNLSLSSELVDFSTNGDTEIKRLSVDAFPNLFTYQQTEVDQTTTSNSANFQSSIFSGWGVVVGVRPKFRALNLIINSWSGSNPITKIAVRVKENNEYGQILAEKIIDYGANAQGFHNVLFDEDIDTTSTLWVEYSADGLCGYYGSSVNEDIGQGGYPVKYTTASNINSIPFLAVTSDPERAIFMEFLSVDTEDIILTEEGKVYFRSEIQQPSPRIILPDEIDMTVGYTRQLFFRGMIESNNPYQWNIKVTGDLGGKQWHRYYEVTPSSVGIKTFTISLYNDAEELITSESMTVNFIAAPSNPVSTKRVLNVGDSLTAGGQWTGEFERMIAQSGGTPTGLGLTNYEMIGTVGSAPNLREGYGGKTWGWFISETTLTDVTFNVASHDKDGTDINSQWEDDNGDVWELEEVNSATALTFSRVGHSNTPPASGDLTWLSGGTHTSTITYTSVTMAPTNPFWNTGTGQLDFANYVSVNGFGSIDYCNILLTWNGQSPNLSTAADHASLIADAKVFLDQLVSDFPSVKVNLMGIQLPSPDGGLANNYGDATSNYGNYYSLVRTVNGLNLAYQDLANDPTYSGFVRFINTSIQFDNENNMPQTNKAVNLRNIDTEVVGTNGVHPANSGYLQIADAIFNGFNNNV